MIKYNNPTRLHPFLCAMLAYNDYDFSEDPTAVSTTSLMKPTNMLALERKHKLADKEVDLEALIPSVMGNAMHSLLEKALEETTDEVWAQLGIPKPEKLEVRQEIRTVRAIDGYNITGKYDMLYMYDGSEWHLADLKTMSVWALIIDPAKKKEEFIKQLSIYRWLNQDEDISDDAEILFWYTDWSKADSVRKSNYPPSRIGNLPIRLWSIEDTETYIKKQLTALKAAEKSLEKGTATSVACSDSELWKTETTYKYYKNPKKLERATKNFDSYSDAHDRYMKDGSVGTIITVPGQAKRCNYCSVTAFCEQYKTMKVTGLVKDL